MPFVGEPPSTGPKLLDGVAPSEVVQLLPFYTESSEQQVELKRQRILCGWDADKLELWLELTREKRRQMFWIFPADTELARKTLRALPDSEEHYLDLQGVPPSPPNPAFRPLGHICLSPVELGSTEYTISTFFILRSQQGTGLGNIVMKQIEVTARETLGASALVLDTFDITTTRALDAHIKLKFDISSPALRDNEKWYAKLGYKVTRRGVHKYEDEDADGNPIKLRAVFMAKQLQ